MEILYQDNRILVCIKPSGVVSTDEPGGMPQRIRDCLGDAHACVRTVHRLDAAVAGVMVLARTFEKEYLAVLSGIPDAPEGTLRDLLFYDRASRTARVMPAPGPDVKEAVLDYRVLGTADGCALVHIRLHTGRTHQIRVQFASRGLPLLGDRKYGAQEAPFPIALWSYRLRFSHPQTGLPVEFSRLPPDEVPWSAFRSRS